MKFAAPSRRLDNGGPRAQFGSPEKEYGAARDSAALFDFSDRTVIKLTGSDRTKFLHNFSTSDIKRLMPGQGCETFLPNAKGRVLAHAWVDFGDSTIWLDVDAGLAERILLHLERYIINEDVQLHDATAKQAELLVAGPRAQERLASLGLHVDRLNGLEHRMGEVESFSVRTRRLDVGPIPAYALFIDRIGLDRIWEKLVAAGCQPAGTDVWTALRIETGLPLYGQDISEENLAQEVGRTKTAISFTKGCYLGQEPIARLDALGHVNRELRSLQLATGPVPERGTPIFAAASVTPVGTVTSAAFSYATRTPVVLSMLRSSATAIGTQLQVGDAPGIAATVFWMPDEI